MLIKRNRLTKKGSFTYVYLHGKTARTKTVTLHYVPAKSGVRIGISVSNKAGKAVVRNKIKRRMRAILRETVNHLAPCQAVFSYHKAAADSGVPEFAALRADMQSALSKCGLIQAKKMHENKETQTEN